MKAIYFFLSILLFTINVNAQLFTTRHLRETIFETNMSFKTKINSERGNYDEKTNDPMTFVLGPNYTYAKITYQGKTSRYEVDYTYIQRLNKDKDIASVRLMLKNAPFDIIITENPFLLVMLHYRYGSDNYVQNFLIQSDEKEFMITLRRLGNSSKYIYVNNELRPICPSCQGRGIIKYIDCDEKCDKCNGKGYFSN
jgi:hypothetical protein